MFVDVYFHEAKPPEVHTGLTQGNVPINTHYFVVEGFAEQKLPEAPTCLTLGLHIPFYSYIIINIALKYCHTRDLIFSFIYTGESNEP